ncbi:Probable voltage-dependent N-type calcium channel subunit alpha-1B (DOE-4) (Voltage-gated calcium channel subunit alpha Cav2.2) [Durusdinium trenchii]|uniref:Probable voltage-dependent N-type calcium channel subunit alpha-1B (DOE-4) (Voltage-gated calcium channel subunit alpha Cav2.2) n=1 Tax=Durusdinium trenchii TaxID=1381693 RepID=A0ABP0IWM9_9DINO
MRLQMLKEHFETIMRRFDAQDELLKTLADAPRGIARAERKPFWETYMPSFRSTRDDVSSSREDVTRRLELPEIELIEPPEPCEPVLSKAPARKGSQDTSGAQYNMYQAQSAHRKAMDQQDRSSRAHGEVMTENMGMYSELHNSLEHKVKTSQRLVEKLQHRAHSVENSLQHTRQTLAKLEEALIAKEAPLTLCTWRMEQRERRPLREQVRDTAEVCLEVEKATLVDAQRKLKDFIKKTKATIHALETKLEELRHDIQVKTQALSVDELCLRTTSRSLETVSDRSTFMRPSGSPSYASRPASQARRRTQGAQAARHEVSVHESARNEVLRQQEALRLNQSAVHREQAAKELRDEAVKLIQRTQRSAEEAMQKSQKSMKERVNENQHVRRRLEQELRETCNQINMTKSTIHDTKTQIKSLEEPMELTSTCASWRKQRAAREHIQDPVTTTLQEHQMTLLRCHEDLRQHHQNEKSVLQDLQEKKEQLKEDLREKTCALHIDLNCLTHEATCLNGKPSPAISRQQLPKAMKVDPTFVPNPGHAMIMQLPLTARISLMGWIWTKEHKCRGHSNEDQQMKNEALSAHATHVRNMFHKKDAVNVEMLGRVPWRQRFRRMVEHPLFDVFFAIVVIVNAVFVGIDVDSSIPDPTARPPSLEYAQYTFAALFTMELIFRFCAAGFYQQMCSEDWMWTLLDITVVASSLGEIGVRLFYAMQEQDEGANSFSGISSLKAFRIIRLTRILKTAQLVRIFRFVMALRTLVQSVLHTLKALIWAMMLLLLIVYVFAVLFAQTVNDHKVDFDMSTERLRDASIRYFGSLPYTMLTLFMSIAGGVSWEEPIFVLIEISTWWTGLYIFYIAFTYFAVLNVVTAVFCQSAIESASNDHATVVQNMLDNKESHLQKLRELFSKLGDESTGAITFGVFEEKIRAPAVRDYFETLGLDVWDPWSFFKLLDTDGGGSVEIEEFFMGCLRFSGQARAMDVGKIIQDQSWILRNQGRRLEFDAWNSGRPNPRIRRLWVAKPGFLRAFCKICKLFNAPITYGPCSSTFITR